METPEIVKRLRCPCCGREQLDPRLALSVRHIFGMLGHDLPITSGYRCEKHNAAVGGAVNSMHMQGKAVDIAVSDPDEQEEIAELARKLGFGGVGWGKNFIHLDFGPFREWRYGTDGRPVYRQSQ